MTRMGYWQFQQATLLPGLGPAITRHNLPHWPYPVLDPELVLTVPLDTSFDMHGGPPVCARARPLPSSNQNW
eukprot:CAMPEP_0184306844 /NCGR_PEP_ID=MMETSP1049-20130417/15738_1 /TAXON_ID=77928 /ORGANISM="Proteomonas sulcata, Strain CCMP704" /LENGTH=71 /DNA_ID=CAMNT_0026619193 /DNA_START=156 /DNA_END=368 /DNA_ORIENTATION=+